MEPIRYPHRQNSAGKRSNLSTDEVEQALLRKRGMGLQRCLLRDRILLHFENGASFVRVLKIAELKLKLCIELRLKCQRIGHFVLEYRRKAPAAR